MKCFNPNIVLFYQFQYESNLLHEAIVCGHPTMVKLLIDEKADVNSSNEVKLSHFMHSFSATFYMRTDQFDFLSTELSSKYYFLQFRVRQVCMSKCMQLCIQVIRKYIHNNCPHIM